MQNFEQSENVVDKELVSFTREELMEINEIIKEKYPNVTVRNIGKR